LAKHEKKDISILFINIKDVFDHIFANQLLKIYQNLGLSKSLYSWIECFMNNRYLQLAFNGNKQEKTSFKIDISQDSSVSPILFLIYIRNIFPEINIMHIRSPSYINDIALSYALNSIKNNCEMLELAAEKLL